MFSVSAIRTVVGVVGNVISFFLFAAPMPTIWKIYKKKAVEGFQPYPYISTIMNCMLWVFYGLPFIHPDSLLVVTINGIGLVMELIYLFVFFYYCDKKWRAKIGFLLFVEVVAVAGLAMGVLIGLHTHKDRSRIVGICCVVFGICMYASPALIMWKVIKTKSVKYMPLSISVTCFVNGGIWFVYGRLKIFDLNIQIPNGTGACIAAVQLVMYAYYKCRYPKAGVEPCQVELSASNSVPKEQQQQPQRPSV